MSGSVKLCKGRGDDVWVTFVFFYNLLYYIENVNIVTLEQWL